MNAHVWGWGRRAGHALWLSGSLLALMATNDNNGCADAPQNARPAAPCQSDSDCTGDPGCEGVGKWQCEAGVCKADCEDTPTVGCQGDDDCDAGLVCNAAHECVKPDQPLPAKCTSSDQCAEGQYCTTEDGECQSNCAEGMSCPAVCWGDCKPKGDPNAICYADSDCGYGQFCDRDPCVFPDAAGPAGDSDKPIACGGVCADREGCTSNDQCGPGEVCACAPYPTPSNGLVVCFMQCQPAESPCTADSECQAGYVCQNGVCVEPQRECRSSEECPAGWQCLSACAANGDSAGAPESDPAMPYCPSYCVPPQETCGDSGQVCQPGESCQTYCTTTCYDGCDCAGADCGNCCFEECKSACVPDQTGCTDDSQCPAGTHCGCANMAGATPGDALWCDLQCIKDEQPPQCWSDVECGDGYYCDFSSCGAPTPCDPAAGVPCDERPAVACPGTCQPKQPAYDCKSDADCISADGRQGICQIQVCEAWAVPCSSDDPSCVPPPPPPPICYGYCNYDAPVQCDPNGDTCPAGMHCEAVGGCGGSSGGSGFMPCFMDYQCVSDQAACVTDCDCDPALACNNGVCERMGRINTCGMQGCASDSECRDGEVCYIDPTQPVCDCMGCPCSIPHGYCGPAIRKCAADTDCAEGEYCGCGPDPSCPMCDRCLDQCMPKLPDGSCDTDADCAAGQTCKFYYPPCAPPADGFAPPECAPIGVCEAPQQACIVTGCMGTICAAEEIPTTCEERDYYKCYSLAICGVGGDGSCGWQKTDAFVECMAQFPDSGF